MTSPSDESRTELVWREIVENYGARVTLPSDEAPAEPQAPPTDETLVDEALVDEEPDDDPVDEIAVVDRFQPPLAPPIPLPRTWQRALAWGGILLAPILILLIALLGLHPPRQIGWALVAWPIGGFVYLFIDMPPSPREPWDDGSRV